MVTTETAKGRYDFLAHQIGGLAVSLMTRTVAMDPDTANRYGYEVQAFLDMADCALEEAQSRATAAEECEQALLTALARIDDLACRLCAETMDGDVEQWALEIAAVAQDAQHGAYMADDDAALAALDGSEGA